MEIFGCTVSDLDQKGMQTHEQTKSVHLSFYFVQNCGVIEDIT